MSRQTSEAGPLASLTQHYDLAGRRSQLGTSSGYGLNYQRLVTGEMTSIADGYFNPQIALGYDSLRRRTSVARYGINSSIGYDGAVSAAGAPDLPPG